MICGLVACRRCPLSVYGRMIFAPGACGFAALRLVRDGSFYVFWSLVVDVDIEVELGEVGAFGHEVEEREAKRFVVVRERRLR